MISIGNAVSETGEKTNAKIGLDLPTLVGTRMLITASSGGGKSWALRKLAEQTNGQIQVIIIDPEGEFSTLRQKYSFILAGHGGDVAAEPKSAKILARKVLELGVSTICDLSELQRHAQIRFVRLFLESLIESPRKLWRPMLVVIDEADKFAPEKGKAESLQAVIDLSSMGRKRGFCAIHATQRISKLSKDACADLRNRMIGVTALDLDQRRAADELGLSSKQDRLALRDLPNGSFHCYGPAWHNKSGRLGGVNLIRVGQVKTEHPEAGTRHLVAPPEPDAKTKAVISKLVDLPAEAEKEARTVADLQKQNSGLKRDITKLKRGQPAPVQCNHGEEIRGLRTYIKELERHRGVVSREADKYHRLLLVLSKSFDGHVGQAGKLVELTKTEISGKVETGMVISKRPEPSPQKEPASVPPSNGSLSGRSQQILNSLLSLEHFGIADINRQTLGAHVGLSWKSGNFNNLLGQLRSAGLIDYPIQGIVALTEEGRSQAEGTDPIQSVSELHEHWYGVVGPARAKLLRELVAVFPEPLSKPELADRVGLSANSGNFNNLMGKLRTFGAIIYPQQGMAKASDILFPEGR